jgi:ATP-dependent Clp protease protease subunit
MTSIPKNTPLVYVSFSAEINVSTAENLIAVMANCANEQVKQVYLLLSTPGGSVREGCNLYNVLRGMPFELVTHNTGTVGSVGNAIFLAGSKRYAARHSTFMFHGVGHTAQQQQRFEQKDFEERLSALISEQKVIGSIITEHTKISESEIAKLFRQGETKDSEFAVEKGIIDEIREVQITPGCHVIPLVFKR